MSSCIDNFIGPLWLGEPFVKIFFRSTSLNIKSELLGNDWSWVRFQWKICAMFQKTVSPWLSLITYRCFGNIITMNTTNFFCFAIDTFLIRCFPLTNPRSKSIFCVGIWFILKAYIKKTKFAGVSQLPLCKNNAYQTYVFVKSHMLWIKLISKHLATTNHTLFCF